MTKAVRVGLDARGRPTLLDERGRPLPPQTPIATTAGRIAAAMLDGMTAAARVGASAGASAGVEAVTTAVVLPAIKEQNEIIRLLIAKRL